MFPVPRKNMPRLIQGLSGVRHSPGTATKTDEPSETSHSTQISGGRGYGRGRHLRSCRATCSAADSPPPSDMLNIAGVGVGGMGRANLINLASQNIVALCDVDWGYARAFVRAPGRRDSGIEDAARQSRSAAGRRPAADGVRPRERQEAARRHDPAEDRALAKSQRYRTIARCSSARKTSTPW